MSDPTPGGADKPESDVPATPDADVPETADMSETPVPETPEPQAPAVIGGDETARIPVEPEVAWNAPEPPRAMPWEAPAAGAGAAAGATAPPVQPTTAPDGSPAPGGVLSAATVGWVAPPPEPIATGQPGWEIASTWVRFAAYLIDGFVCALLLGFGVGIVLAIAPGLADGGMAIGLAYGVASAGLYFVYFVGFWTSGAQATPGMRLLKLRVANAADGKRLAIGPATVRWLALGYIFTVVSVIPALSGLGLLAAIWWLILLVTTATDRMHQGAHDKWAKSVIVRPQGAGAGAFVAACLIIVLIIGFFFVASIVGLILLGSQLSNILSAVGESI